MIIMISRLSLLWEYLYTGPQTKSIEKNRSRTHIMLRDLLTQKCVQKFLVTDFGYPRACRFRKYQIENRSLALVLPIFSKRDFLIHKMLLKLAKIDQKWAGDLFSI
jgi:hypothetical protein